MNTTKTQIQDFIDNADRGATVWVSDYQLARDNSSARHLRGGRIPKDARSQEGGTRPVHAFWFDEVGNIVALCADGGVRQFINSDRRAWEGATIEADRGDAADSLTNFEP